MRPLITPSPDNSQPRAMHPPSYIASRSGSHKQAPINRQARPDRKDLVTKLDLTVVSILQRIDNELKARATRGIFRIGANMTRTGYVLVAPILAAFTRSPPLMGAGGQATDRTPPPSTLELSYNLYVGGVPLRKAAMSVRFQGTDYKAHSSLETTGIVNAFWQSKIEAASNGLVERGNVRPALYDSYSQNRNDARRQVTLTFGPEGPKSLYSNPPYPEARYKVSEEQQRNTLDPL